MKNNKSTGKDQVNAEMIKYAPIQVHHLIADIYNEAATLGTYPAALNEGLLTVLQKSEMKIAQLNNVRPIVLLSTLCKILAIIMTSRIKDRIEKEIPLTQAAYLSGRSTPEHAFALKPAVERTLTSKDETLYLILIDMSKAFDSINRKLLLPDPSKIINEDKLHIIQLLLNVKLEVRYGKELSEPFTTDTGAPQGDCDSASQFTFYLAKILEHYYNQKACQPEHDYALRTTANVPIHMEEHGNA